MHDNSGACAARGKSLEVWFQDEARVGQQGTLTRTWAGRGTRPRAPRDTRYEWVYIFGAVCPARTTTAALVMPRADASAMEPDEQRDVLGELEITARLMITGGEDKEEARMTRADRSLIRQCILDAAERCHGESAEKRTVLTRDVRDALRARGNDSTLPEMRRVRLLEIANKCPVHKALEQPLVVESALVD